MVNYCCCCMDGWTIQFTRSCSNDDVKAWSFWLVSKFNSANILYNKEVHLIHLNISRRSTNSLCQRILMKWWVDRMRMFVDSILAWRVSILRARGKQTDLRKAQSEREAQHTHGERPTSKDPQAHHGRQTHEHTRRWLESRYTHKNSHPRGPLHWVALRERFAKALKDWGNAHTSR